MITYPSRFLSFLLLARVVFVSLVFLVGVELGTMDCLDVFSQGAGISVALSATWGLADVWFLKKNNYCFRMLIDCVCLKRSANWSKLSIQDKLQ